MAHCGDQYRAKMTVPPVVASGSVSEEQRAVVRCRASTIRRGEPGAYSVVQKLPDEPLVAAGNSIQADISGVDCMAEYSRPHGCDAPVDKEDLPERLPATTTSGGQEPTRKASPALLAL